MRPEIFLPLALLFLAHGVPSKAQKVEVEAEGERERRVSVRAGAPLTVECSVRVEQRVEWSLDGGEVPADLTPAGEAPAASPGASRPRLVARLHAPAARPHHAGLYTCSRDSHSQRVRVLVTATATATAGEPTTAAAPADWSTTAAGVLGEAAPTGRVVELEDGYPYDVGRMFSLNCTTAGLGNTKTTYVWRKNGTAVELLAELADRYTLEDPGVFRMIKRTHEDDFGNYTCDPSGGATRTFRVRGRPYAKLPSDTNVVEDTNLKIVCKVVGKPHPRVEWTFSNDSSVGPGNGTPVAEVLGARVKLSPSSEQGVEDAMLEVAAAARSDAGVYTCKPVGDHINVTLASTTLRVKDKFAALWPFLGICAEVFVLCAIILVYEKRRTKPELDDSDTDNHDQKKS